MGNMLCQKQRAEIGFDVSKVLISTSATKTGLKFEDAELIDWLIDNIY